MNDPTASRWSAMFRALAVYGAAAWAIIEGIGFLASYYELSRSFLDSSLLVAIGGGLATLVVTWFHGPSGRQKVSALEVAILAGLAISVAVSLIVLWQSDPLRDFEQQSGARLVIEFPTPAPNTDGEGRYHWGVGPPESIVFDDRYMYTPFGNVEAKIPGLKLWAEDVPVLLEFLDTGHHRISLVFPDFPRDLAVLMDMGKVQEAATVETMKFLLRIEREFQVQTKENTISLLIVGPFLPATPSTDDGAI